MSHLEPNPLERLSAVDLQALRAARSDLETPGLSMKLASLAGAPFEKLLSYVPAGANSVVADAAEAALRRCLQLAMRSLGSPAALPAPPRNRWHKAAVAVTGAAGGAFGLLALPIELPLTTTVMFRSIGDIARSQGEDLTQPETQLQCLTVLGMGGTSAADDNARMGYFVARGTLAQAVSKAAQEMTSKGLAPHGSAALLRLVNSIAARFSVQVSEQIAAKSIPAIGAVLGATVNTIFIGHFQQMARGHFVVRRLERRYGEAAVRAAYDALTLDDVSARLP
jgi:hypothetical protein